MKILMVCLGNICRSPLAHGILEDKIRKNKLIAEVDSAGTGAWHIGEPPDQRSVETALNHGINISNQRARKFNLNDFNEFDIIFVMDTSNLQDITNMSEDPKKLLKVKLILNEVYPNQNKSVPDPYYGGESGFEKVYQMLNVACDFIIKKIRSHEKG